MFYLRYPFVRRINESAGEHALEASFFRKASLLLKYVIANAYAALATLYGNKSAIAALETYLKFTRKMVCRVSRHL